MRLSTLFGRTLRDVPTEAEHPAHQLVLRAGLVRQMLAGGYALLPLGMRVARRIEAIMHAEMARIDGQELRAPLIQATTAWEQTGRYTNYGPLMLRMTDRGERPLIFAPTNEEAIAELARRELASYRQLPAIVYQIHTKYRDEARPRHGLMRMREFTMLDAYSLDGDTAGLDQAYARIAEAFERIFARCGIRFLAVEAASGEMGGREAREYMALSPAGEDTLAVCPTGDYAANLEIAAAAQPERSLADAPPLAEVATPNCATIAELAAFLDVPEAATAKAVFFDTPERGLIFAVIRGDRAVNEVKLQAVAGVSALNPASAEQIAAAGATPGYASPVGLAVRAAPASADSGVFVIADPSVAVAGPLVAGANRAGYHARNVVYGRDWQATLVADIGVVAEGDPCPRCGAPLRYERGIELGHIFKLGTRYTEALGVTCLDPNGVARLVVMGSYGIGIERLIHVIVEQHHDAQGIAWPAAVAPFAVHLVRLGKKPELRTAADALYADLTAAGVAVLYDDRDETAGVKFNDADLIGLPLRLLISDRLLAAGAVEVRPRGGEASQIPASEAVTWVQQATA